VGDPDDNERPMRLLRSLRQLRAPRVLALDLSQPVTDAPADDLLAKLRAQGRPALRDVLEALEVAASDPRIDAVVAKVDAPAETWAHAQELHAAILAFRASGKPALAHAQSFSEAGNAVLAYLVATAFDEIHLQPTGDVGVTGVASVQPFVADLLDRLDVVPELDHRHEYKAAKNLFTERGFTDAHREAADRIVASLHEQLVATVAAGRDVSAERAATLIDQAPHLAEDALANGLVDRLAYRDETFAEAKRRAGEAATLVPLARYRSVVRRQHLKHPRRPTLALVHGHGAIAVGRSRPGAMGATMGADTVVAGFQQAINDEQVRAILFRVESPGGSAVASDAIWRAVARAREAGKPVVVSMGGVAGSGGYWVSMGADRIVASPGTITGSIGVVYGKIVARGLFDRVGITTDEVHRGDNALLMSTFRPFTEEQRAKNAAFLDQVYDTFVDRVAAGRGLDRAHVHEVARGRVWTGADARERGLIDEVGGYREALATARSLAGIAPDAPVKLAELPHRPLPERLGLRAAADPEARALLAGLGGLARLLRTGSGARAQMPSWTDPASRGGPGR
jgi:protease IV